MEETHRAVHLTAWVVAVVPEVGDTPAVTPEQEPEGKEGSVV